MPRPRKTPAMIKQPPNSRLPHTINQIHRPIPRSKAAVAPPPLPGSMAPPSLLPPKIMGAHPTSRLKQAAADHQLSKLTLAASSKLQEDSCEVSFPTVSRWVISSCKVTRQIYFQSVQFVLDTLFCFKNTTKILLSLSRTLAWTAFSVK